MMQLMPLEISTSTSAHRLLKKLLLDAASNLDSVNSANFEEHDTSYEPEELNFNVGLEFFCLPALQEEHLMRTLAPLLILKISSKLSLTN